MEESNSTSPPPPLQIDGSDQDLALANSKHLTSEEVLRRRLRRLKQLEHIYKDLYWILMEELKSKHRYYWWLYGKSPLKEEHERSDANCMDASMKATNNANNDHENVAGCDFIRCNYGGCKSKAMALTKYCHTHILSDPRQELYRGCAYVTKSLPAGPVLCPKPILRSTVPPYCPAHIQTTEKLLLRQLRKAGLNIASTHKLAPKFHVLIAAYVRQIQTKRRAAKRVTIA